MTVQLATLRLVLAEIGRLVSAGDNAAIRVLEAVGATKEQLSAARREQAPLVSKVLEAMHLVDHPAAAPHLALVDVLKVLPLPSPRAYVSGKVRGKGEKISSAVCFVGANDLPPDGPEAA
jgi:hypothetical protein